MQVTVVPGPLHFQPTRGWINDPHGLTWHDGLYHLFFQHVPDQDTWAPGCHWGHAVSDDLVRWTERPPALSPGDGDDGCWSGSLARTEDGEATIFYTSISVTDIEIGRIRVARPADGRWDTWVKGEVVAELPLDEGATHFRDPFVLRDADRWRMLVGAGFDDGNGGVLAYSSPDLRTWRYDGPMARRARTQTDAGGPAGLLECPQLVRLGATSVLLASIASVAGPHHVEYALVDERDGEVGAQGWRRLSYGPCHYAASVFADAEGRPGLITWLRGVPDAQGIRRGALSLPMLLGLDDGRLVVQPHPNVCQRLGLEPPVHVVRDGGVVEVFGNEGIVALTIDQLVPGRA